MRRSQNSTKNLNRKLIVPLLAVTVMQVIIFCITIQGIGLLSKLDIQAYRALYFQVHNKAGQIEDSLNDASSNFDGFSKELNVTLNSYFKKNHIEPTKLSGNKEQIENVLKAAVKPMIEYSNVTTGISGVFFELDASVEATKELRASINLQNLQEDKNGATLTLKRGPVGIAREYKIPIDEHWEYEEINKVVPEELILNDYFTTPMTVAKTKESKYKNLGYWSDVFYLNKGESSIITYTIPLLDENSFPYGICGIQFKTSYIQKKINDEELSYIKGAYILNDNNQNIWNIKSCITSGGLGAHFVKDDKFSSKNLDNNLNIVQYKSIAGKFPLLIGSWEKVNLYKKSDGVFKGNLYLFGLSPQDEVLSYSKIVKISFLSAWGIILIFSIVCFIYVAFSISNPVTLLSHQVEKMDPDEPIILPSTNIKEIDEFSQRIEQLSIHVVSSASRLSTIINLVGIPIGGFEIDYLTKRVFATDSLYNIIKLEKIGRYIPLSQWEKITEKIKKIKEYSYEDVYRYPISSESTIWIRMKTATERKKSYGVIMDCTEEIKENQRLQFERDHDSLTKILNRNSFNRKARELIISNPKKIGALLFCDLDNLKYLNDNYGHDFGDQYIKNAAIFVSAFEKIGGISARMAGDEFTVFIHGYDSREQLKEDIDKVMKENRNIQLILPDGNEQRLRMSTGIAWYPKDATNIEILIKYADFAMYEIKNTTKGLVGNFDLEVYNKKAFLRNKVEALSTLLEKELIRFVFQPIVSSLNGEIFGYEMFVRPDMEDIKSPYELIQIAEAESKLYQLEKLLTFKQFQYTHDHQDELKDKYVFINMMRENTLNFIDIKNLTKSFSDITNKIILEVSESDTDSFECDLKRKVEYAREHNCKFALIGKSSFTVKTINSFDSGIDFVKIHMSVVRDIGNDDVRKHVVESIIKQAHARGVKVVAEGIETLDEMKALKELSVDYFQGYYIGRPEDKFTEIKPVIVRQIEAL